MARKRMHDEQIKYGVATVNYISTDNGSVRLVSVVLPVEVLEQAHATGVRILRGGCIQPLSQQVPGIQSGVIVFGNSKSNRPKLI